MSPVIADPSPATPYDARIARLGGAVAVAETIRRNHSRGLHNGSPREYCPDCRFDAALGEGRR